MYRVPRRYPGHPTLHISQTFIYVLTYLFILHTPKFLFSFPVRCMFKIDFIRLWVKSRVYFSVTSPVPYPFFCNLTLILRPYGGEWSVHLNSFTTWSKDTPSKGNREILILQSGLLKILDVLIYCSSLFNVHLNLLSYFIESHTRVSISHYHLYVFL